MAAQNLGNRASICSICSAILFAAERVHSSSMANPRIQTCCNEGQVKINAIPEPPELFKRLLTSEEREAKEFQRKLNLYNRAFAFTSFNYTAGRRLEERGALREGAVPSYAQVYFLDGNEAVNARSTRLNLNPRIVSELTSMIETTNPFVNFYRTAHESFQDSNLEGEQRVVITPQFRLMREDGTDRRRFNLPTVPEFAIFIPYEVDSDRRDIILYQRRSDGTLTKKFQYIHRCYPAYFPLPYVLFYPFGNPGYHWAIKLASAHQRVLGDNNTRVSENQTGEEEEGRRSKCVSARLFYRYHLFSRIDPETQNIKFNTLIQGRRLFQQLCCDMYACVDDSILNWHRINQDIVRADLQFCVIDALRSEFEVQSIGRPVILSSSYIGGDRHMVQCYQDPILKVKSIDPGNLDEMAIVRLLYLLLLLLTHLDLIAITFKSKLDALLHDVKDRNIFGVCLADLYTIEYQKRGLPHAHILLFLHRDHIPQTAAEIDELVSAHLPTNDPELAAIIKSQLTHGPCGPGYPNAPYMRDWKCSKRFPKRWCEHTVVSEDSYPEYARPDTGETWGTGAFQFDNRWVVPYNAYLTKKYVAHINVEVARGVQAIKYIEKYIYKGSDRALLTVDGQYDEIAMTLQGRYISPVQAVWRLMGYTTHEENLM
ncbi:hypothetical protein EPUL_003994 [Erysiphe pulchra]|uniref:Helitron helicase-like domain-containing protein n=1 Tax=Erysiphe pulchra TaxID=225359 RepID=A0A2S4PL71_9PEZI|nr:hypothetical protein EPUL_003994 [Erysiphe pulchra]